MAPYQHFFASMVITFLRTGKASNSITGILGSPFISNLIAFVGQRSTHSPQKTHFSASKSTCGFCNNFPSCVTGEVRFGDSLGHMASQIPHPTHWFVSNMRTCRLTNVFLSKTSFLSSWCFSTSALKVFPRLKDCSQSN
jgi:hypothetical protein